MCPLAHEQWAIWWDDSTSVDCSPCSPLQMFLSLASSRVKRFDSGLSLVVQRPFPSALTAHLNHSTTHPDPRPSVPVTGNGSSSRSASPHLQTASALRVAFPLSGGALPPRDTTAAKSSCRGSLSIWFWRTSSPTMDARRSARWSSSPR